MNINIEKTKEYYKEYQECRCSDCINFYKEFPKKHPKICDYLSSMGIDPLKPFELCSIYNKVENRMEYLLCMYVGIGIVEDDFEKEIDGLKITVNKNFHPSLDIPEAFVLEFGPIYIKKTNLCNRHLTREEKIKIINNVLIKNDPIGLIKSGSPLDEYIQEAQLIESSMTNFKFFLKYSSFIISRIFSDKFDVTLPTKVLRKIRLDILYLFYFEKTKKEYLENEQLKDKISFDDNKFSTIFRFHENFKIEFVCNEAYINDKHFAVVEEQDILYTLLNLIKDNKVFIQYKKKRLFRKNFKVVNKKRFVLDKYKNNKNIELIFDINGIIK